MNWLYNKNIIISGASSGIGKELVKILVKKYNCRIMGVARNEDKLLALKKELSEFGLNFNYYVMDVSINNNWKRFKNYLINTNFMPDVLINNAGTMTPFEKFLNIDEEKVERVFKTNFFASTYSIRELLPVLENSKTPAIINISSASALCVIPGVSIYSASKSALKAFSETLHIELHKKVYVCTIMPGFAKTNLFKTKDNSKDIISDIDKKIVDKFSMEATKMANKIISKIKHKKARAIIGIDAKLLNAFYKMMPNKSGVIIGKILKKSKMESFKNVN